ncbi:hypothetical protein [Streptosporangium saharense]|uniref:hypothetical protein n=1 Tax=Streptosporangium saharense TaxID=1706840 RepID=UPI003317ABF3
MSWLKPHRGRPSTPRCGHPAAIPVEADGEVVAGLCPDCDAQLPAGWFSCTHSATRSGPTRCLSCGSSWWEAAEAAQARRDPQSGVEDEGPTGWEMLLKGAIFLTVWMVGQQLLFLLWTGAWGGSPGQPVWYAPAATGISMIVTIIGFVFAEAHAAAAKDRRRR